MRDRLATLNLIVFVLVGTSLANDMHCESRAWSRLAVRPSDWWGRWKVRAEAHLHRACSTDIRRPCWFGSPCCGSFKAPLRRRNSPHARLVGRKLWFISKFLAFLAFLKAKHSQK